MQAETLMNKMICKWLADDTRKDSRKNYVWGMHKCLLNNGVLMSVSEGSKHRCRR